MHNSQCIIDQKKKHLLLKIVGACNFMFRFFVAYTFVNAIEIAVNKKYHLVSSEEYYRKSYSLCLLIEAETILIMHYALYINPRLKRAFP